MTSDQIRQTFLEFFEKKGHKIVPSAPIVIKNDPSLLFTNAGMNQFKDYFLGNRVAEYGRVTDSQKCLRASGKHNDLDDVGKDTYHHTMFEMLGNWSFGDYFKKEAIAWAWELLTEVYKLEKDRLYITIFEGDKEVALDTESKNEWEKWISADRILACGKKDNFWEMGSQGPCGPCSEIHIDLRSDEDRAKKDGKELVNEDHPEVIEIWNNVFIQYNRTANGQLESLPQKHVDTGMGLERLVTVLQKKQSNYDTDIFERLIEFVEQKFNVKYGKSSETDTAIRVLVDHVRAVSFTIADGQLPSNTGAGYVIRRILRRAVRYAYRYFNSQSAFLCEMSLLLSEQFRDVYPELWKQKDFVSKVIKEEEHSFLKTLSAGTKKFEDYLKSNTKKIVSGDFAFELYDTYGFPLDLTQLIAEEENFTVDIEGYNEALLQQKKRSKADAHKTAGDWILVSQGKDSDFVGYDTLKADSKIRKYRQIDTKGKTNYQLVLDQTPFYPEGGGQVGDTGFLSFADEKVSIIDTKKENELIVHTCKTLPKTLESTFSAQVSATKRQSTERNHSVTHLLHAALRQVLGEHVAQKGSLVNDKGMRFDFSHFQKVEPTELQKIEQMVLAKIRANIPLQEHRSIPIEEAKAKGAMMLFGEKYGETVRMITFDPTFSQELCGGCHVPATGAIGSFKIVSESAVAAGVRRIEVITGEQADAFYQHQNEEIAALKQLLKNPKSLVTAAQQLIHDNKSKDEQISQYEQQQLQIQKKELLSKFVQIGNHSTLIEHISLSDARLGKDLIQQLAQQESDAAIVLASAIDGKAHIWIHLAKRLTEDQKLDARKLIKLAAPEIKGGGGGQAFSASAGGKNPDGLKKALELITQEVNAVFDA